MLSLNIGNTGLAGRWDRLVDICASLPEIWDVRQLLELAVAHASSFFDAECCVAFLATDGRLAARAWSGLPTPLSPEAGERLSRPLYYDGIRGWLEETAAPPRGSRFLVAPMVVAGQQYGALALCAPRSYISEYQEEDDRMLRVLAQRVGSAVAGARLKVRLFEESEKQRAEQEAARRELEMMALQLKRANEQLIEANARSIQMTQLAQDRAAELQAILDNIVDVVFFCNSEEQITFMNAMGTPVMGEEDELSRTTSLENYLVAHNVRHPDGQPVPREESAVRKALGGEVVRGMEQVVYDPRLGQDRYVLLTAAPVYDPRGRLLGAITVRHDITQLKELDQLKDKFMVVASHEIKTPVTSIKGFAQSLLRSTEEFPARHRASIEAIVRGSDRIDELLKEFLEVSTMRWGRMVLPRERLDLTGLVAEVVGRQARMAPTSHRLITLKKDQAWVLAGRDRLDQVLTNLLDNAVRYSPDGGTVEVSVTREEGSVTVSVKDGGVGIPVESQPHIFERFFRGHLGTPQDYGGLGVGLYISREIVRRLGGDMGFTSRPGESSTFYFTLPLAP